MRLYQDYELGDDEDYGDYDYEEIIYDYEYEEEEPVTTVLTEVVEEEYEYYEEEPERKVYPKKKYHGHVINPKPYPAPPPRHHYPAPAARKQHYPATAPAPRQHYPSPSHSVAQTYRPKAYRGGGGGAQFLHRVEGILGRAESR